MNVRYRVELTPYERNELAALLSRGEHPSRVLKRAQILLAADQGVSDEEIATSIRVGGSTVYRTKRHFVEGNLERALSEEPRPGAERKLSGKEEALLEHVPPRLNRGILVGRRIGDSTGIDSLLGGGTMPKAYSGDMRERVIAEVESGASRREAAEEFEVSASTAIIWVRCFRETGRCAAKPRGGSTSPLEKHADFLLG